MKTKKTGTKLGEFIANNKQFVNFIYGVGAAIVLLGALFKILHLPFANTLLMVGMLTEVFLFLMSAFEPIHKEYDWEVVFPQLEGDEIAAKPIPQPTAQPGGGTPSVLSDAEFSKLKDGLNNLSEAAGQLTDISSVKSEFTKNIKAASESFGEVEKQNKESLESLTKIGSTYKVLAEGMNVEEAKQRTEELNDNLSRIAKDTQEIGAIYELQLASLNKQMKNLASLDGNLSRMTEVYESSLPEIETFKKNATGLKNNVQSLNEVYGNMLSVLNP